ncbi:hypothetical protein [Actinokineospora sp. HUAS TT18]
MYLRLAALATATTALLACGPAAHAESSTVEVTATFDQATYTTGSPMR